MEHFQNLVAKDEVKEWGSKDDDKYLVPKVKAEDV